MNFIIEYQLHVTFSYFCIHVNICYVNLPFNLGNAKFSRTVPWQMRNVWMHSKTNLKKPASSLKKQTKNTMRFIQFTQISGVTICVILIDANSNCVTNISFSYLLPFSSSANFIVTKKCRRQCNEKNILERTIIFSRCCEVLTVSRIVIVFFNSANEAYFRNLHKEGAVSILNDSVGVMPF